MSGIWEKWQTLVILAGMLIGFAVQGAVYFRHEGERETKIDYLVEQVREFAATRYTKDDALKDQAINTIHYQDVSDRLKQLEFRANRSEGGSRPR
jgi:hypothetical protein